MAGGDPPTGLDWNGTPEDAVRCWCQQLGGVAAFIRDVVLPRLNAWLLVEYPPIAGSPPAAQQTTVQQLDAAIGGIKLTVQADGTVTATA